MASRPLRRKRLWALLRDNHCFQLQPQSQPQLNPRTFPRSDTVVAGEGQLGNEVSISSA